MHKNIILLALIVGLVSCNDEFENDSPQNVETQLAQTRAVITPDFEWENLDWMPTPSGQSRIPSPWVGQGSLASLYGMDVINDRKKEDGWVLLYNSFDANATSNLNNPYFVLYNQYRGTMRIFLYITTPFVASSSYLQDGLSVLSPASTKTTMLNFLGDGLIDGSLKQTNYVQMQKAPSDGSLPLATNKWYMMEYELAYDPNIANMPYNNIQLSWFLNYYNVTTVDLGGTATGTLKGTIGSASSEPSNMFSNLGSIGKSVGTGVMSGIGTNFLTENTINATTGENKIGVPNAVFKNLVKGIEGALSGAANGLPGAIAGLIGGVFSKNKSGATTASFVLNTIIDLKGNTTNAGAFPSTPISFWMPGTNISSNAVGYIPLYNKPLGIMNFTIRPEVLCEYRVINGGVNYNLYSYPKGLESDYSKYLVFNPEVLKIADIIVRENQIVIYNNTSYIKTPVTYPVVYEVYPASTFIGYPNESYSGVGVRFTIEVKPKNGNPSTFITKTFKFNLTYKRVFG